MSTKRRGKRGMSVKIWIAKLKIEMNDDEVSWGKRFTVECDGLDYCVVDDGFAFVGLNPTAPLRRYIWAKEYNFTYSGYWYKVEKGYNYKPSQIELRQIEKEMTEVLRKKLVEEKQVFEKRHSAKMRALME